MNPYEQGFISQCNNRGVNPQALVEFGKQAGAFSNANNLQGNIRNFLLDTPNKATSPKKKTVTAPTEENYGVDKETEEALTNYKVKLPLRKKENYGVDKVTEEALTNYKVKLPLGKKEVSGTTKIVAPKV